LFGLQASLDPFGKGGSYMKSGSLTVKEVLSSGETSTIWQQPIISCAKLDSTAEIEIVLETFECDCQVVFQFSSMGELVAHTFKVIGKGVE
jgi:hypothetical protein